MWQIRREVLADSPEDRAAQNGIEGVLAIKQCCAEVFESLKRQLHGAVSHLGSTRHPNTNLAPGDQEGRDGFALLP